MNTLPPPIIEIKHEQPYKVTERHISQFNSLFDNLQAKEKKARETKIKKDSNAKRKERERRANEKAIGDKKAEADRIRKENERKRIDAENRANQSVQSNAGSSSNSGSVGEDAGTDTQGLRESTSLLGATWDAVSPLQASEYMASKTGVSVDRWLAIINAESTNNPYVTNSIGCYGYLQLHPVHGAVNQMTPQQYLDTAVSVYNSQGLSAWEVVTMGRA